jgi:hypothetical protein
MVRLCSPTRRLDVMVATTMKAIMKMEIPTTKSSENNPHSFSFDWRMTRISRDSGARRLPINQISLLSLLKLFPLGTKKYRLFALKSSKKSLKLIMLITQMNIN